MLLLLYYLPLMLRSPKPSCLALLIVIVSIRLLTAEGWVVVVKRECTLRLLGLVVAPVG